MMSYVLVDKNGGQAIAQKAEIANTFFSRMIGLMFRPDMDADEALLFYDAPSIHTCFMKFPIDIVFLNKDMQVIRICSSVGPWKAVFCSGAHLTIELKGGCAAAARLSLGDFVALVPKESYRKS